MIPLGKSEYWLNIGTAVRNYFNYFRCDGTEAKFKNTCLLEIQAKIFTDKVVSGICFKITQRGGR